MSDANEFPVVWTGILRKMRVEAGDPVAYHLKDATIGSIPVADHALTPHVGGEVHLRFLGEIRCTLCGRATKKTFGDGFCFPCSQSRPEADICIVKPELCHHGQADHPCRDEAFAQSQCFQPHVLYVSLTSGVKVGITRRVNLPSRWIDQGAVAAVPLAQVPDRRAVGLLEKRLSDEGYADKTHWTRMLKGDPDVAGLEPVARGGGAPRGLGCAAAARVRARGGDVPLPGAGLAGEGDQLQPRQIPRSRRGAPGHQGAVPALRRRGHQPAKILRIPGRGPGRETGHSKSLIGPLEPCGGAVRGLADRLGGPEAKKITCIPVNGSYYERQLKRARAAVRRTGVRLPQAAPEVRKPYAGQTDQAGTES